LPEDGAIGAAIGELDKLDDECDDVEERECGDSGGQVVAGLAVILFLGIKSGAIIGNPSSSASLSGLSLSEDFLWGITSGAKSRCRRNNDTELV